MPRATGLVRVARGRSARRPRTLSYKMARMSRPSRISVVILASALVGGAIFGAWAVWVILMLRAARGDYYQLPIIGRWAEANA